MNLLPTSFLFRLSFPCVHVKNMPKKGSSLLNLPKSCIIQGSQLSDEPSFAEIRVGWNETGIGFQARISGKEREPVGDSDTPKAADGVTLWIDTRDARSGHRASRTCHQFHLLPTGGGDNKDEPTIVQVKIPRALQDAPIVSASEIPYQCTREKSGYLLEAFFSTKVLTGFDPEQHNRLGFYFAVRDEELGNQYLQVGSEFPFAEDPSLWATLELCD